MAFTTALSRRFSALRRAGVIIKKRLKKTIDDLDAEKNIDLQTFVDDVKLIEIYKQALAFVYPSKIEGFGFQGLETMACKTLVIASDIPVFREIYEDNVIYFGLGDENSLTKSFKRVLNMKKEEKI